MIHFGTAGWRGLISEDFTFLNVRRVAHCLSGYVKEDPDGGFHSPDYRNFVGEGKHLNVPLVVVGYDGRFLSDEFAHEAAGVLAMDGVKVLFSNTEVPTPAAAWAILQHRAVGGIMITASHNPAEYNGFKWMSFYGGLASVGVTQEIERRLDVLGTGVVKAVPLDRSLRGTWVETMDFRPAYFKQLLSLVDAKAIRKAKLKVGVDAMHGAARLYLRPFLESLGVEVVALREDRDVLFGGHSPEPSAESLQELCSLVVKKKLDMGLACDGDADRFGIVDVGGRYIEANDVIALLFEHLVTNRGFSGKAARSLMTSHFLDAVAKSHGQDTRETPVGFKFIGELLRSGQYLIGGEESGGLSIKGHVPEKDGLLACVLALEMAATAKKPLAALREGLFKKLGAFHHARLNYRMGRLREKMDLEERLRTNPPLDLAGGSVWRIDDSDGFKFILRDGSWLGLRSSGTEPVFRLYAEASSPKRLDELVHAGKKLLGGKL